MVEPAVAFKLIYTLGLILLAIGLFKLALYLIGELFPSAWARLKSKNLRTCLTGVWNRLIFGLGGFLTALLGGGVMWLARFLTGLYDQGLLG